MWLWNVLDEGKILIKAQIAQVEQTNRSELRQLLHHLFIHDLLTFDIEKRDENKRRAVFRADVRSFGNQQQL